MARPTPMIRTYRQGMRRDNAREAMPEGSLWNMVDYVPEVINARLRRRGGWRYGSPTTAHNYIANLSWAPFTAGGQLVAITNGGYTYRVDSSASAVIMGTAVTVPAQAGVFYNNLLILTSWDGVTAPYKYNGTTAPAALGGSPPAGRYAVVYKDVLWTASSSLTADRIWFSVAGNPESWDLTNKYLDNSQPITGLAALANAVLVFSLGHTTRIRGSIPPPDTDFIVDDPQFAVGCTDARSIANYRDKVIFANAQGLYITDGTAVEDLTRLCGMKSWWREVMLGLAGFATGTAYSLTAPFGTCQIIGGVYGDYYFYSVMINNVPADSGFIDLTTFTWHRVSNFWAQSFAIRPYPEELFWGRREDSRVGTVSDIFLPTSTNYEDGDGDDVQPYVETGFFEGPVGEKTFRNMFLGYDLRAVSGQTAPTLTVSYIDSPEETSYTALSPNLAATTAYTRSHVPINIKGPGIAFKVAQNGLSTDTRLYGVELDLVQREPSR